MRRVVVTGLGIVSSIGNNADEVHASLREANPASSFVPSTTPSSASAARSRGAPKLDLDEHGRPPRRALHGRRRGLGTYLAMEQAIADAGLERGDISNERTGIVMGSGGPSTGAIVAGAPTSPRRRSPKRIGPFMVPQAHVVDRLGRPRDRFKIKGAQLLDLLGLLDLGALHRQWRRADPVGQAGHACSPAAARSSTGRCRCCSTPWARCRPSSTTRPSGAPARLRRRPRRLRHRRRRRRAGARGARARQGARRQDLCRDRRLRRHLGRLRHGGAVRRRRGALHAAQALSTRLGATPVDYINTHGTSTPVGDIKRDGGDPRGLRRRQMPQISSTKSLTGHSLGRRRRAGGDLFAADDEGRLHRRQRPISRTSIPAFDGMPIVRKRIDNARIDTVMSNSFGFGGTNATLVFQPLCPA